MHGRHKSCHIHTHTHTHVQIHICMVDTNPTIHTHIHTHSQIHICMVDTNPAIHTYTHTNIHTLFFKKEISWLSLVFRGFKCVGPASDPLWWAASRQMAWKYWELIRWPGRKQEQEPRQLNWFSNSPCLKPSSTKAFKGHCLPWDLFLKVPPSPFHSRPGD